MGRQRGTGISRHVRMRNLDLPTKKIHNNRYGISALRRERERAHERYEQNIQGLGGESLRVLAEIQGNTSLDPDTEMNDAAPESNDWEDVIPDVPEESLAYAARDMLDSRSVSALTFWTTLNLLMHRFHRRYHVDNRTWRQRLQRLRSNWEPLMEALADAYLAWKYAKDHAAPILASDSASIDVPSYDFTIDVIDIYNLDISATIHRTEDCKTATALVLHGYLGTTPEQPSFAMSLRTLELYYRIRRRKPSFSIEAFAKVICDLYKIPYRRKYRDMLADAFDVYLHILRIIDTRVAKELGRDGENWRVLNACPPCTYMLEDEPPLRFSRMFAIDGNNSLKRVAMLGDRHVGDTRTFEDSSYYLSSEYVDQYANEVKKSGPSPASNIPPEPSTDDNDGALNPSPDDPINGPTNGDPIDGDPTDGDPTDGLPQNAVHTPCAENWKAAAKESNKKMWAIFDETGIFASACRHGLILWIADMIRSGELAKYSLAVIAKALEVLFPGFLTGYDIGCILEGTIDRSSLGKLFQERGCHCCVNAFHGYSHNYLCQVQHHPNVIEGMGLEDLETLERIFSSSNQVASVTRYMSKYRRRVFVDLFFRQWDEDKYANLANMLYNNYNQALRIINVDRPELQRAMETFEVCEGDLEKWRLEQKVYFSTSLGQEPEGHVLKIAYVERLRELRQAEEKYKSANNRFIVATPDDASKDTYASALSATRKRETERRYADERRDQLTRDVTLLEEKLGITRAQRWTFSSPEFLEISKYISRRKYEQALDKLQKLVIQRLFELQKMNLSYTAYKMRTHIAKSLQTRCQAIRNAVATYNKSALELDPPQPTLDWSRVSHYTFLEDFALLRNTDRDIREKPWAKPVIREMIKQDQKVKRAQEEIIRCNVEVRRLHTSIRDEEVFFSKRLPEIKETNGLIYGAVEEFILRRRRVNAQLCTRIYQIYSINGFTGVPKPGVKKGSMVTDLPGDSNQTVEIRVDSGEGRVEIDDQVPQDEEDDDDAIDDFNGIVDFVGNL
ncbi:hypothetical protein C0992_000548 [Termitomyces sp. T32_za158]|nr:hypothetical protein C0992_000548 [Termitomyces sp. T32_za158]